MIMMTMMFKIVLQEEEKNNKYKSANKKRKTIKNNFIPIAFIFTFILAEIVEKRWRFCEVRSLVTMLEIHEPS